MSKKDLLWADRNPGGVATEAQESVIGPSVLLRSKSPSAASAVAQLRLLIKTIEDYRAAGRIQKRSPFFDELEIAIKRVNGFIALPPEERGELPTPLGWLPSETMQLCRGYDPVIVFWANTIETVLGDFPPARALAYIQQEWHRIAHAAGWEWGNTHWRFNDGGSHSDSSFQLYVNKDGLGDLHAWDQKGRSLGQWTLSPTDAKQRHATVREMVAFSRQTNRGQYRCSGCGVVFPEPTAGHYFAGVYCEPCWNAPGPNGTPSVREQEAKETYN